MRRVAQAGSMGKWGGKGVAAAHYPGWAGKGTAAITPVPRIVTPMTKLPGKGDAGAEAKPTESKENEKNDDTSKSQSPAKEVNKDD